jgi:transposase InsO family protein
MPSSAIIVRAPPTCRPPDGCRHSFLTHRGFNAVMESFFSSVKSEVANRFDSCGEARMELFDYIEVFYNQRRRHSTLGQISPAAFEGRQPKRRS